MQCSMKKIMWVGLIGAMYGVGLSMLKDTARSMVSDTGMQVKEAMSCSSAGAATERSAGRGALR